jgi:hypothetical protein
MTRLSPNARDLIEAARAGERPPAKARERVRAGVLARVGAGAAVGSATLLGAKTAISAGLLFKVVVGVGVASVLAGIAVTSGVLGSKAQGSPPPVATVPVATAVAKAEAPAPPAIPALPVPATAAPASSAAAEVTKPSASSTARPRAATPVAGSSLEAETALLEKAQAELRAGHPDRALAELDQQDAEFKQGTLGQERRAGRILALCAAGRKAEAKAEAERFLAESPHSPTAARVRSSCAGDAEPSP